MSSKSLRAWVVAVVAAVASLQAHAAGLGRLEVKSALGDAFRAEISVLAEKAEIAALSARMASTEAFDRAGLIYGGVTAAIRVSVEKRANGEPYVLLTSVEKINEPVVDLLVELSWASGRVTREYTAFVDPPFIIAEREKQRAAAAAAKAAAAAAAKAAAATTQAAASEPLPEPQPLPEQPSTAAAATAETPAEAPAAKPDPIEAWPVKTIGGTAPTLLEPMQASASGIGAQGESYAIKRGDTLSKIALQNKPSDITLEQMLVLLFRNNPDAFAGKNMNRLKTGKIIQLASPEDYAALTPAQARQEVRVQSADWNAYRERLAEAAGEQPATAEPAKQAAAGQVTTKVEDQAKPKAGPKEVLKLSEGSTPGAAAAGGSPQQRTRAQEEELVARDKAINEANQRVARLEKTISDLQALLEVKNQGMAELQKQAAGAAAPAQQPATKPAATPQAATNPATAPATQPAAPAAPTPAPKPAAPAPDVRPQTPAAGSGPETPQAQPAPQAAAPAPAPKPRPKASPPPPPPPSLLDQVLEQPYYLGGAALLLLLVGFGATRVLRRRREAKSESEDYAPASDSGFPAGSAGDTTQYAANETEVSSGGRSRDNAEEVDPLEEAEIFLAYGRDAQAEELLNEALASHPRRYEIHIKLLEIYAKRQDKTSFERVARELQKGTDGSGDLWQHAVKLGYQVDPSNSRYAAGRPSGDQVEAEAEADDGASPDRLDFDVGLDDDMASTTATDIDLGAGAQFERTQIINPLSAGESAEEPAEEEPAEEPSAMDFNVELPDLDTQSDPEVSDAKAEPGSNSIDFKMDVDDAGAKEPESTPDKAADTGGLDFDIGSFSSGAEQDDAASASAPALDLSGISLDLDGSGTSPVNPAGKDEKWYEVQTKFDLAKAYQEMGDKDGAREILREVIAEGDADQKAAAEAVLTSLE